MKFQQNDGGRAAAGFKGKTGDCVTRAITLATGIPYKEVYEAINQLARAERKGSRKSGVSSARNGVYRFTYERYLKSLGWRWTPTMKVGQGCKTHLRAEELPAGRLVVIVSRHLTAVIDGVIYDTHDPSREGSRCVYGYWQAPASDIAQESQVI
jgi:hypothetical protein